MTLPDELRWCSSNTFCLVQLFGLFSLVCGLRTERPTRSLQTLPTPAVLHALSPSSAWVPVTPGSGHESFVVTRQNKGAEGRKTPPHRDMETVHHDYRAGSHGVSFLDQEPRKERSPSLQKLTTEGHQTHASWIEVPGEVHRREVLSSDDDTVLGKAQTTQELTDEDLHRMNPREGLLALLSQGKDLVTDIKSTLDGIDAVVSLGRVTQKIRDEIQKDVQALNRTIAEEFKNIEQLRQLQDAQTAVLRSQLSFLTPARATVDEKRLETTVHAMPASGERAAATLPSFWFISFLTVLTMEVGFSILLK